MDAKGRFPELVFFLDVPNLPASLESAYGRRSSLPPLLFIIPGSRVDVIAIDNADPLPEIVQRGTDILFSFFGKIDITRFCS